MIFSKLMGQFVDVIQWTDDSPDTMVWRFERQGNEIKYGAKLTVREGQMAVFVNEGEIADTFTPGMYELYTRNLPILSTLQAWPHGFESPFKAEVYFCSTRIFTDLKWGTKNPVIARDPEFGPVRLRAFGTYAIRIKDPSVFLREVVGTDGHFTVDEISDQLRNIIVVALRHDRRELGHPGARPCRQLRPAGPVRARPDRAGVRQLRPRAHHDPARERLPAARGRAGDGSAHLDGRGGRPVEVRPVPGRRGDAGRGQQPGRRRAGDRHDGGDGRGPAGEPVGRSARPSRQPPPPPPPPAASPAYHLAVDGKATGPFGLDQLRQQAAGGGLTAASLVWAPGMAGWQAAGEVAELKPLLAAVPPPVPRGH